MSRTKRTKPTLKVHEKPDEPSAVTEMVVTETLVAKAAQEVADEKLAEAKRPKPRRVGPLRKIHMATLERSAALAQPMLQQIGELRRQVGAIQAKAIDDVLEDLGEAKREAGEDARIVEEGGETFVDLARAPTGPAVAPRGTRRRG